MATTTHGQVLSSTNNVTTYTTAAFTPANDDLLVVAVFATGTVADATISSSEGITFASIINQADNVNLKTADRCYLFVANSKTTAVSQTVTFDCTGDAATGAIVHVYRVSGMTKTGSAAVRQWAAADAGAQGTAPTATFAASCLTGNPVLTYYACGSTPPTVTVPTNWTAGVATQSYTVPATGGRPAHRDSGFTGTAVAWSLSANSADAAVYAVELDASAAVPRSFGVIIA